MKRNGRRSVSGRVVTSLVWFAPLAAVACSAEAPVEELDTEIASEALKASKAFVTSSRPYVVAVSPEYTVQPLLSVGDRVPRTSNPSQRFQFVGIPDGMGAHREHDELVVYVNHELVQATVSEPILGAPLSRGAIVSRLVLDKQRRVVSGDLAYDTVYDENTLVGPAADTSNTTSAFSRFCSGSLAYEDAGFDRPIYFAGEESSGAATYDGRGGLGVAIFDGELHTIPKFGRFPWENLLAQPKRGDETVLIGMEDGPATTDNQLYMYVGKKERIRRATAMRRNGLDNGSLYVFVSDTPGKNTELEFTAGTIEGHWVEIPNADALSDAELEEASDAVGAFGFVRTEDGAFDPVNPDVYYFVTTGSGPANLLGRLYKMTLSSRDPRGKTKIELVYNADTIIAGGGDTAVSPDNIDVDDDYIFVTEDGTAQSREVMAEKGRHGSVWRFSKKKPYTAVRVAELFPPGRDANFGIGPGVWETTGILSVKEGSREAWLLNVQAHAPTVAPLPNTVEDGQLVLLRRSGTEALK